VKTVLHVFVLRKIFENIAAETGSLLLKEGEFTCMCYFTSGSYKVV
jgi:hypothetical protein